MDLFSFRVGNALVGNTFDKACLEITLLGPEIKIVGGKVYFTVTGGNLSPFLNDKPISLWQTYVAYNNDIIKFKKNINGCRSYLCFSGGIEVPTVLGSRSTFLGARIGGFDGRKLEAGDKLNIGKNYYDKHKYFCINRLKQEYIPFFNGLHEVRCVLGPQDGYFNKDEVKKLFSSEYVVTNYSDRIAYRLDGPNLKHKNVADIISDGTTIGSIQIPANGLPIVFLSDRPTNGGYSKIATVISSDIYKIAQLKVGDKISFKQITIVEAHEIYRQFQNFYKQILLKFS